MLELTCNCMLVCKGNLVQPDFAGKGETGVDRLQLRLLHRLP